MQIGIKGIEPGGKRVYQRNDWAKVGNYKKYRANPPPEYVAENRFQQYTATGWLGSEGGVGEINWKD